MMISWNIILVFLREEHCMRFIAISTLARMFAAIGRRLIPVIILGIVIVVVFATVVWARPGNHATRDAGTATALPLPTLVASHQPITTTHPVGSDFSAFYQQEHGATWLGEALTQELAQGRGEEQIFEGGVMLRSGAAETTVQPVATVTMLATKGAEIPLVDPTGDLSYATLTAVLGNADEQPAPWWWNTGQDPRLVGLFVPKDTHINATVGYYIPATFVPFLQGIGNWQLALGSPLSQAQSDVILVGGYRHHISVMPFERGILWYDSDVSPVVVHARTVGEDFVQAFGIPSIAIPANRPAWTATGPLSVAAAAGGAGTPVASFLTPFSIMLAGDATWIGNQLWYHIRWTNLLEQRDGWISADQIAFTKPAGAGTQLAELDALSPQLQNNISIYGDNITMAIYDPGTGHYYAYYPYEGLEMASTFKVVILTTLLHETEQQGRSLTDEEQQEAAAMIEVSDNVAEGALYDDAGDYWPITNYMNSIGIDDIAINTDGIGSTLLSPLSAVKLMEDLRTASILTRADSNYILGLMSQVVSFQQVGVADTAPPGATWSMKIGYGPGMDSLWLMVSIGTVTYKGHAYDMAIFSRDWSDFDPGASVVDTLCSEAVQALTGTA
jgi:hypothetical protein